MSSGPRLTAATVLLLIGFCTVSFAHSSRQQIQDGSMGDDTTGHHGRCEPITIPFCMGIAYNETIMPNLLGQQRQDEAGFEVQQYYPLVKIQCSHDLQFFLCSVFVPVCTIIERPIPPCRSLCVSARNGCESIMNRFQIEWPDNLECSKFPENGQLCVGENNVTNTTPTPQTGLIEQNGKDLSAPGSRHFSGDQGYSNNPNSFDIGFVCPQQFRIESTSNKKRSDRSNQVYTLKVGNKVVKDCGVPCDAFWSEDQMRKARILVASWSVLCAISCLFTSLTFAIDTHRFRYPERPIIFLSLCYLMVSVSYLIGYLSGNNVACNKQNLITQGTDDNEWCTVLFMVSYFFSTASSVWWVVLTLTWFLAAGLKWGHEAIEANSHYFHLAAWTVPAAKTITVLAMGKIEGDVLTGICSMAVWSDDTAVRDMVLIPLVVYLILGTAFWMAGFVSLCRIRKVMKHDGTRGTDKLEKLMIRIGVFSVLYTVPAVAQILCLVYEHVNLSSWIISWHSTLCQDPKYALPCPSQPSDPGRKPSFEVFIAKYFVSLLVGLTSSVWIWSGKTLNSWQKFLARIRPNSGKSEAYV